MTCRAVFLLLTFMVGSANDAVAEPPLAFDRKFTRSALCESHPIVILIPSDEAPFNPVRHEDEISCQFGFGLNTGENDEYMGFGVFFLKEKLTQERQKSFAEFLMNAMFPAEDKYIDFLSTVESEGYHDYSYIAGLEGQGADRTTRFLASFVRRSDGTVIIYSFAPSYFWTGGTVMSNEGSPMQTSQQMMDVRKYMEQWVKGNRSLIRNESSN